MDGKNASGRRISLLNDTSPSTTTAASATTPAQHHAPITTCTSKPATHHAPIATSTATYHAPATAALPRRPLLQHAAGYSSFSSASTRSASSRSSSAGSPPTPRLVRSDSSDSNMQTPSPITPEFTFDHLASQDLASPVFAQASFFPAHKDLSAYPVPHQGVPLPYQQPAFFPQDDLDHPQPQPQSHLPEPPASGNPRTKKNSYPCPVAKQFNCSDHFTTSGHAARHAKKHTGKKDAFCPECNKAFTRKDNMEQHRRTHQNGRAGAKPVSDAAVKKSKASQAKRPRPAPLQNSLSTVPSLSSLSMVDPALPVSPGTAAAFAAMPQPAQPADFLADYAQRSPYPDPTAFSMTPAFPGSSYGLDALAIAASGEKRKYDM